MKIVETFAHLEDNRRSDRPVIEHLFHFESHELESVRTEIDRLPVRVRALLDELGINRSEPMLLSSGSDADVRNVIAQLFTGIAVMLQRDSGHRVGIRQCHTERDPQRMRTYFEYEEQHTGEKAAQLALLILARTLPALERDPKLAEGNEPLGKLLVEFREFACSSVLPIDTEILIAAARRADIPHIKLDREPFIREPDTLRIRPNSALRLGHGCRQSIVDGNFCVDRCERLQPYLKDRQLIAQLLREVGLPVPASDREFANCSTASRARRSASRIGYPLVMKSAQRIPGAEVVTAIEDEKQLVAAYEKVSTFGRKVYLEKQVAGETFKIIMAGGVLIGIIKLSREAGDSLEVTHTAHPSLITSVNAAAGLQAGMFVLTLISEDLALPLDVSGASFVDIELAPALDSFLPPGSGLLSEAADHFVEWLFPKGAVSRIPIVAVTGTNGKTTTSRLIFQVARASGFSSVLACSEGIYVNSNLVHEGDLAGWVGHALALGMRDVEFAVLETARGGVAKHGIIFDKCDVAVCTNITEDHLEDAGIETLEQMADLKCSIVKRARHGAVLNADDPRCVNMISQLQVPRIFLVSTRLTLEALRRTYGQQHGFCYLGDIEGDSWLLLNDREEIIPIAPVNHLPVTLAGKAEYNISNALHACAACYLAGIGNEGIGEALAQFEMTFDNTPGRLNLYDGRPFRIVLDYAHNPAGIAAFVKCFEQMEAKGRKIVVFSAASYNPHYIIAANAHAVAGHFDHYICYNFGSNIEKKDFWVPSVLKQSLIDRGVPEERIVIADDGPLAVREIDRLADKGDIVAFLSGRSNRAEIWEELTRARD